MKKLGLPIALLHMTVAFIVVGIVAFVCADYENEKNDSRHLTEATISVWDVKTSGGPKSEFKDPWNSNADLLKIGEAAFKQNCADCHGSGGMGDGPTGMTMTPRPRNFALATGWKKDRKVSNIFETLEKGLEGTAMGSYAGLKLDEKFGLAHYILSLGPRPQSDTTADLNRVGIDPSQPGGGLGPRPEIPIDLAIELIAES